MTIRVEGIPIELTPAQMAIIEKHRKERERCRNSFKKMLLHFGFKQDKEDHISFSHEQEGWYAEIIDRGNYSEVWMTGQGLKKSNGFPGGWIYSSPREIEIEILRWWGA